MVMSFLVKVFVRYCIVFVLRSVNLVAPYVTCAFHTRAGRV